jgi:FtsP/CotA-like multicopper oxidase with cupredoxin domain
MTLESALQSPLLSQHSSLYQDQMENDKAHTDHGTRHPFHLHGHAFQVVTRSEDDAGFYDASNTTTPPSIPMRRDTVLVRPNGHIVLRFRSDNPGK